jgi:hypothetical protein
MFTSAFVEARVDDSVKGAGAMTAEWVEGVEILEVWKSFTASIALSLFA